MTRVVTRLLLTLVLLPVTIIAAVFCAFITQEMLRVDENFSTTIIISVTPYVFCLGFALVWRGVVRWTRPRKRNTFWFLGIVLILATAVSLGVPTAVIMLLKSHEWGPPTAMAHVLLAFIAIGALIILWRERAGERIERLRAVDTGAKRCPACKYDLSAQTDLTCPECGNQFTLGAILDDHRRRFASPELD